MVRMRSPVQIWLAAPYAAIAQPVERILGKDEVASSNLASSSKTPDSCLESGVFSCSAVQSMLDLGLLNKLLLKKHRSNPVKIFQDVKDAVLLCLKLSLRFLSNQIVELCLRL